MWPQLWYRSGRDFGRSCFWDRADGCSNLESRWKQGRNERKWGSYFCKIFKRCRLCTETKFSFSDTGRRNWGFLLKWRWKPHSSFGGKSIFLERRNSCDRGTKRSGRWGHGVRKKPVSDDLCVCRKSTLCDSDERSVETSRVQNRKSFRDCKIFSE